MTRIAFNRSGVTLIRIGLNQLGIAAHETFLKSGDSRDAENWLSIRGMLKDFIEFADKNIEQNTIEPLPFTERIRRKQKEHER